MLRVWKRTASRSALRDAGEPFGLQQAKDSAEIDDVATMHDELLKDRPHRAGLVRIAAVVGDVGSALPFDEQTAVPDFRSRHDTLS